MNSELENLTRGFQTLKAGFKGSPQILLSDQDTYRLKNIKRPSEGSRDRFREITGYSIVGGWDFYERWDRVCKTYKDIQSSNSALEVKNLLNSLRVFLEEAASRPDHFDDVFIDENGKRQQLSMNREKGFDRFFEDRVLSLIRPAMHKLETSYAILLSPVQPSKEQNFLDEIAAIERDIESRCNIVVQRSLNPNEFEPIHTLWERIGDDGSIAARNLYREQIRDRIEFALSHISSVYKRKYEADVKKQPDKQAEILLQHREKYLNLLEEKYPPTIQDWFYRFWNEKEQTAERINDLEKEVFHFCYSHNKPFMVGLKLMQQIYGYCLVVEHFNNVLNIGISGTVSKKPDENLVENSFADLFFSTNDLQRAVEILRKTTSDRKFKVIDTNGRWLGQERDGSRSVLLAWVEVLRLQGWFRIVVTNPQMSGLLNGYFAGLKLSITDDSLWRKQKYSAVANAYHADFLQLIKER